MTKIIQGAPLWPSPAFPIVTTVPRCGTFVQMRTPPLPRTMNCTLHLVQPSPAFFHEMSLSCSRIQSGIELHLVITPLQSSLLSDQFPNLSFFPMTLTVLSSAGFCRVFLSLDLSEEVLLTELGLRVAGKSTTEASCPPRHSASGHTGATEVIAGDVNFQGLVTQVVSARLLRCNVTLFPFPYSILWGKSPDPSQRWS